MLKFINRLIRRRQVRTLPLKERKRFDPNLTEAFDLSNPPRGVEYREEGSHQDGLPPSVRIKLPVRNVIMGLFLGFLGLILIGMAIAGTSELAYIIVTLVPGLLLTWRAAYYLFARYVAVIEYGELHFFKGLLHFRPRSHIKLHKVERIGYRVFSDRLMYFTAFSGSEYDADGHYQRRDRVLIVEDDKEVIGFEGLKYVQVAFMRQVLEQHVRGAYKKHGRPKAVKRTSARERDMRFHQRNEARKHGIDSF